MTRDELEMQAERYLTALASRELASLPLATDFRATENGRELRIGEGLGATATGVGYRQLVVDQRTDQVAVLAVVDESGRPALHAARLAIVDGSILELETLVSRAGESSIFAPQYLTEVNPLYEAVLPEAEQASPESLIATVDGYFDAIEHDDVSLVALHPECDRTENGVRTTRNREVLGGTGCREQLALRFFVYIEAVRERRFPVIDPERGLVQVVAFLDVPGTVTHIELEGGRRWELPEHMRRSRSTLLFELFKVTAGRVRQIEAFMVNLPYRAVSGWYPAPLRS